MKHNQTWLLIAALLALLAPSTLVAGETVDMNGSIEVGAASIAVDDEASRVNEYTKYGDKNDGLSPAIKIQAQGVKQGLDYELGVDVTDNRDQTYNLGFDAGRVFKFDADYQTFQHLLPHDQLDYMRATMKTEAQTAPGSANPAVYSEDLVPGKDFFIIHRELEAKGVVVIPDFPNVALKAELRKEQREGTEQAFSISHCSACHVAGEAQDIDEVTTDVTLGATGKFGIVTVDYEYLTRDFEDSSEDMYATYLLAGKPEDGVPVPGDFNNRLLFDSNNGLVPYADTPDSEKDTHTLKARIDLKNNTVISGTFIDSHVESDKQDDVGRELSKNELSTDYDSYSLRASTRLGNWRFTGFGRKEEIESSDNQIRFFEINGAPVMTAGDADVYVREYESEEARDITTLGANAVYRINSKASVRLGYEYEEIDRDIHEAQDTETQTFTASARFRPAKGLSGRVSYKYQDIDEPFMNPHGNMGPDGESFVYTVDPKEWYGTDFYTKRLAEATNQPEDVHELKMSVTWSPSARFSATFANRYRNEENDLNFNTYEKTVYSPSLSLWYAPINELNLTMAYNFDKQKTENQMCVGWYHG